MKAPSSVTIVVEGLSDAPVVGRIVRDHGLVLNATHGLKGKPYIDANLARFNAAARHGNWLVIRDLDQDAPCPASLIADLLPNPSIHMRFRLAVRAIEAWLMADSKGFSQFFSVAPQHIPSNPDSLAHPKTSMLDLVRKSRSRVIREDMLPAPGTTARVGPGYVARVTEFAESPWSWKRAAERSDSLRRCIRHVAAVV